jgi:hypothetical protein
VRERECADDVSTNHLGAVVGDVIDGENHHMIAHADAAILAAVRHDLSVLHN